MGRTLLDIHVYRIDTFANELRLEHRFRETKQTRLLLRLLSISQRYISIINIRVVKNIIDIFLEKDAKLKICGGK